ncbi:MAG: cytochrome c [Pseudomonadota bacterium]
MMRRLLWLALLVAGSAPAADNLRGQQLYGAQCAMCHGAGGRAVMPGAPSFDRGNGMMRPDLALLASIRAGKNAMPAFQGRLPDRDILDIIAFMRTLQQ